MADQFLKHLDRAEAELKVVRLLYESGERATKIRAAIRDLKRTLDFAKDWEVLVRSRPNANDSKGM